MWEAISKWLTSSSGIILICSIAVTVVSKAIIKIYNLGRLSRVELVTKQEFNQLEANIRRDMRNYRDEIFQSVWELCKTAINTELKDVTDIKRLHEETKVMSAKMEKSMELNDQKYKELDEVRDDIRVINTTLKRLQSGSMIETDSRRSDD